MVAAAVPIPCVRVLHVEDNPDVAGAVADCLTRDKRFELLGSQPGIEGLMERVQRELPHIVIFDLDLAGDHPESAMESISTSLPGTRVVVFTGQVSRTIIDRVLDSGAWAFICKVDGGEALVQGLLQANSGELFLSESARSVYGWA